MKTNIEEIRNTTMLLFDAVPIEPVKGIGFVCQHPFTTSPQIVTLTGELLDLTTPEGKAKYRQQVFDVIKKSDLALCFLMIQTAWKMTWFKYCKDYMSDKDYAEFLKDSWTTQENPNQDVNVSTTEAIAYFYVANKKYLMDEDEQEYYNNLPNTITVYRGVSPNRERYGLSWTDNKDKAIWFKERFERTEKGYLLKATIPKKYALAYLNCRDEQEIVVDVNAIKGRIEEV